MKTARNLSKKGVEKRGEEDSRHQGENAVREMQAAAGGRML